MTLPSIQDNPSTLLRCQRLVLIGLAGVGKTTLARQVAKRFALPHIELDALYWQPNWTPVKQELFHQRIRRALNGECWVVEGNYHECDFIWSEAEMLVWLDLPLPLIILRLLRRTTSNLLRKCELWHGNREAWRRCFLSRDSIFVKLLKGYTAKRQAIESLLVQPQYRHLHLIHLRSSREVQRWLSGMV